MKNFEDISCIFCGEKNNKNNKNCIVCNNTLHNDEDFLGQKVDGLTLIEYKARGFYGLTFKAKDIYGKNVAVKLISKIAYKKFDKDFTEEAEKFANLPNAPTIVNYIRAGEIVLDLSEGEFEFFYIVTEWIDGISLNEFLRSDLAEPEDLIIAARDMLTALSELTSLNLWHNDLHDENILISNISDPQKQLFRRSISRIYKIIDVGSMAYKNPHDTKVWGDMVNVGSHLFQIRETLKRKTHLFSKEDQYLLDLTQEICTQMMDEDPSRNFSGPNKALEDFEKYYRTSKLGPTTKLKNLDDPYGYINANDIPSPWLLRHMFSDKLSYFREIMSIGHQSLVISGPRGCGKTMILKNMRFLTLYDAQDSLDTSFLNKIPYVGLFISARASFGNYLLSVRPQEWIKDESKVMLYYNILVTIELLDVIYRLKFDKFIEDESINVVMDYISDNFSIAYLNLLNAKPKLIDISRAIISGENVNTTLENLHHHILTVYSSYFDPLHRL